MANDESINPLIVEIGTETDSFRNVPVFDNGPLKDISHGRHYSNNGYYFGQKWQCVEFVKRFYYQVLNHEMPDVWGHAKDYFDADLGQGEFNSRRNLIQLKNGGNANPASEDIVVFSDTQFGHLGIITKVNSVSVEIVQQNIIGRPRQVFKLARENERFFISSPRIPDGWLRIPGSKETHRDPQTKIVSRVQQSEHKTWFTGEDKWSKARCKRASKIALSQIPAIPLSTI